MTSRRTRRQKPTIVVASGYRAGLVRATRRAKEKTSAPGGSFTERFTAPFESGQQRPIASSFSQPATMRSRAPSVRSVSELRRQTHGASEKRSPRFAVFTKPRFTSFSRRTIPSCALRNSVVDDDDAGPDRGEAAHALEAVACRAQRVVDRDDEVAAHAGGRNRHRFRSSLNFHHGVKRRHARERFMASTVAKIRVTSA